MKGIGFYGEDFFTIKEGQELLFENITRVLLTLLGERVMSNFGSRLKDFLFAPESVLKEDVVSELNSAINRWEPRVKVQNADAEMIESNKAQITLNLVSRETLQEFDYDTVIRF